MDRAVYEAVQEFLNFSFRYNNMNLLIDRAAKVVGNPVAVFDKNYYTVAYSDISGIEDEVWTAGKERGYCLFEYAAMLHGLENMRGTPLPYQVFDDWGPNRRRICPLGIQFLDNWIPLSLGISDPVGGNHQGNV